MKLGTHNSMSYLKPKKWYLSPFRFIAKCQSLSVEEQYKKGARMFDIRVSFDSNNNIEFRHGSMAFKGNPYSIFNYLENLNDRIYIRLILEDNRINKIHEVLFRDLCMDLENTYKNLIFFAGYRKCDWMPMYKFKAEEPYYEQEVSSMRGTILDDLWPWLYAKLHNRKSIKKYSDTDTWVLLDFIEIQ